MSTSQVANELLQRVLASPGDDDLRLVCADALLEAGDPRGEFIILQYQKKQAGEQAEVSPRELALMKRYGWNWIDPLAPVISVGFVFDRGFLSQCRLSHRSQENINRVAGHPIWSTVESFGGPPEIYLSPAMLSLRTLIPNENT